MTDSLAKILDDRLNLARSDLGELAREILSSCRAKSTLETYRREWSRFVSWAASNAPIDYPVRPEILAAYLTWLHSEGFGRSTIRKAITVMSLAHDERDNPTGDRIVRELIKGILRRDKRPTKKARPLTLAELVAICDQLTEEAKLNSDGLPKIWQLNRCNRLLRDRALISVGWMAALRASELVALNWADIIDAEEGIELRIRESKSNKTAEAEIIALPLLSSRYSLICPVRNLRAIQPISNKQLTEGWPVFRTDFQAFQSMNPERLSQRSVSRVIERSAKLARLESRFSSHCLRRGFATFAASKGLSELQIMRHGRWKSSTVAAGYVERSKIWSDNPLSILLGNE